MFFSMEKTIENVFNVVECQLHHHAINSKVSTNSGIVKTIKSKLLNLSSGEN